MGVDKEVVVVGNRDLGVHIAILGGVDVVVLGVDERIFGEGIIILAVDIAVNAVDIRILGVDISILIHGGDIVVMRQGGRGVGRKTLDG